MPKRKRIALVACEACRTRKSKCDGTTPVCGPCQTKRTPCAYPSDPNISRFAALKSDYERVKTRLEDLTTLRTTQARQCFGIV
ncbi:hypothetical protein WHR41_09168 [Cladosporium halotolerans]|uniref:Zn(2)-C6 fungal-type domain-containing protein n=1 Tax=Cladosporium halotolerans TaxID=1052096 RepID=A0AB34KAZ6_9PEZI